MKLKAQVKAVSLNFDFSNQMQRAAETAARIVFPELNSAFQDALGSEVWPHPLGTTIRSNGSEVGSPRNIVDTGILRASNTFTINGLIATFGWTVGHATAVHYGATIYPWGNKNAKPVTLPPKPWTSAVLGTVNVSGIEPYPYKVKFKDAFIISFKKSR